jgi:hypothetical protein
VCEAGLGEAFLQLQLGEDGNLGSEKEPIAYGSASFWVEATDLGDERTALLATGVDDRARASIEMIVEQEPGGFFDWGAFADVRLHMDSNARVDSYDSADGSYAAQTSGSGNSAHANENGDVGSNGPISMDSNTVVWGDATPGPSSSVAQNGNSEVTGSTTPLLTPVVFPPITVPAGGPGANALVNGTQSRAAGTYFNVAGPATIVVRNLTVDSNSEIRIDASGGPVTFYVARNFTLNSNAKIYSLTRTPADVAFNLSSAPANTVLFDSNVELYGTVYAPQADIRIDSNAQIFGSIVAWRLELNSNSMIHYDEAHARQGAAADSGFRLLCWRVVEQ